MNEIYKSGEASMGGVFNTVNMHLYHYAGNNPVRYVDPDGRLRRDSEGRLIFSNTGRGISTYDDGVYSDSALVLIGYLWTDDGHLIEATANITASKPWHDTDCHGYTFAEGRYWINNNQVDLILKGDNYKLVTEPCKGDVVVYRDKNGDIVHSMTVVNIKREHSFLWGLIQWGKITDIQVEGLGGLQMEAYQTNVNEAWKSEDVSIEYYRKEVRE